VRATPSPFVGPLGASRPRRSFQAGLPGRLTERSCREDRQRSLNATVPTNPATVWPMPRARRPRAQRKFLADKHGNDHGPVLRSTVNCHPAMRPPDGPAGLPNHAPPPHRTPRLRRSDVVSTTRENFRASLTGVRRLVEPLDRASVPLLTRQHVDDLSELIDRADQVPSPPGLWVPRTSSDLRTCGYVCSLIRPPSRLRRRT